MSLVVWGNVSKGPRLTLVVLIKKREVRDRKKGILDHAINMKALRVKNLVVS